MAIEIESRNPGILAHVIRKQLNELLSRYPHLRKSVKVLVTSHSRLVILIDESLDTAKLTEVVLGIVSKVLKDYSVKKMSPVEIGTRAVNISEPRHVRSSSKEQ
jgi:hypothetical protein